MNSWLAVGAVVVLLLVVVLIGTRRPRRAEDELKQPKPQPQPAPIDTPSSLDQADLMELLRSIKAGRETGTLQLTAGDRAGSLYFLFGHLFHATSGSLTGEPALHECLAWQDVHFTFDKTSTLPTEETILRPIDQILG